MGQTNAATTETGGKGIGHRQREIDRRRRIDRIAALRQNGGTTFKITVNADRCDISNMSEGVFRTDSSSSVAKLTNSRLHNSGTLCIGSWASCSGSGNTNY